MPKKGMRAAVLAAGATALAASAAAEASAQSNPSFPRARDAATVAAWLHDRTDMPLAAVVVSGPDAAFAVLPSPGLSQVRGGRRVRVVQEVIDPAFVPTLGGRSAVLELDVDCAARRVMRQAFDIYGGSNLGGQAERLGAGRAWSQAEPGTPMAAIVSAACTPEAAPRPLYSATLALAEPQGPGVAARVLAVPSRAAPLPAPGARPVAAARAAPPPAQARPAPIVETPLAPPPAARPAPARPASGPAPMVVLGEYPSLDAARAAWAQATAGAPGKVQRIELASGRFRALVDGYGSGPEAEAACAAIRVRGGNCSLR